MDLTTMVIDLVIVLVIVAVVTSAVRTWHARPVRLAALPPEARSRYLAAWQQIEKRFMDAPAEAAQRADALVTGMLGERGHPLVMDRLPYRLREARRKLAEGQRRHSTEDLRQALLDYRALLGEMVGPEQSEPVTAGRRETA